MSSAATTNCQMCRCLFVAPSSGSGSGAEAEGSIPKVRWGLLACYTLLLVNRQQKHPLLELKVQKIGVSFAFPIPLEMAAFSCPGKGQSWAGPGECGGRRTGANSPAHLGAAHGRRKGTRLLPFSPPQ